MKKRMIGIFVCMLLIATALPAVGLVEDSKIKAGATTVDKEGGSLIVTLESALYTIADAVEGKTEIMMEGYGSILVPGCPKLPSKTFLIGVPPGGEVVSVELISEKHEMIPGSYNIVSAPPFSNDIEYEINDEIYSSSDPYPTNVFEYLGMGQLRKYSFARVRFSPISYVPASGKLIVYKEINLKIEYKIVKELSSEILSDTVMDDVASESIVNYPSIYPFYIPSSQVSPLDTYDYVIITTSSLESSISFLKNWKEFIGYSVKVVNISWISVYYTGLDLEEEIRNFLKDKYSSWGIEYVLIVGSHSTIPMRDCYPDENNHNNDGKNPTDYYYADLTGNWDSDGDGFYGERYDDSPDFNAEVWVGRIPVDTPNIVEDICQKTINFEQDNGAWKEKALSCAAIANYENEDNSGNPRTDFATLMEELWNDVYNPNGFSQTTMYEKAGLSPSTYSCDYDLTKENVITYWPDGYGIVSLDGHGNAGGVYRKIWESDDGDGVPEGDEMDSIAFISSGDCNTLNDDKPSIVFSAGCKTAYPENPNNLGKSLLVNGSIAYVGATRNGWYTLGWDDESNGGCQAIEYYYFKYLINNDQTCGKALYNCKSYYLNNFDWWEWHIYQNLYDYCLYGDPSISLTTYSGGSPPDTPGRPSGSENGRPLISYTYSTSTTDPDGHQVYYKWYWGDGSYTDWLGPYPSGGTAEAEHEWATAGEYEVKVKAKDAIGAESSWSEPLMVTMVNSPPNKPAIAGETNGAAETEYEYTFSTVDSDGDDVKYYIVWGDGNTEWTDDFSASGTPVTVSHTWAEKDTYTISAKAKDEYGAESEWATLEVEMPVNQKILINPLLQMILERFPNMFPILRHLIEL